MKSEATASRWCPGSDSSWISDPGQALAGQGTGPDQLRLPTAIYVLVTGEIWRGIALLLCGAIGSVDNFVRPLVIGGRVEMPTFLLLFVLLGGLQVYSFLGIFVGPSPWPCCSPCWRSIASTTWAKCRAPSRADTGSPRAPFWRTMLLPRPAGGLEDGLGALFSRWKECPHAIHARIAIG